MGLLNQVYIVKWIEIMNVILYNLNWNITNYKFLLGTNFEPQRVKVTVTKDRKVSSHYSDIEIFDIYPLVPIL